MRIRCAYVSQRPCGHACGGRSGAGGTGRSGTGELPAQVRQGGAPNQNAHHFSKGGPEPALPRARRAAHRPGPPPTTRRHPPPFPGAGPRHRPAHRRTPAPSEGSAHPAASGRPALPDRRRRRNFTRGRPETLRIQGAGRLRRSRSDRRPSQNRAPGRGCGRMPPPVTGSPAARPEGPRRGTVEGPGPPPWSRLLKFPGGSPSDRAGSGECGPRREESALPVSAAGCRRRGVAVRPARCAAGGGGCGGPGGAVARVRGRMPTLRGGASGCSLTGGGCGTAGGTGPQGGVFTLTCMCARHHGCSLPVPVHAAVNTPWMTPSRGAGPGTPTEPGRPTPPLDNTPGHTPAAAQPPLPTKPGGPRRPGPPSSKQPLREPGALARTTTAGGRRSGPGGPGAGRSSEDHCPGAQDRPRNPRLAWERSQVMRRFGEREAEPGRSVPHDRRPATRAGTRARVSTRQQSVRTYDHWPATA